METTIETNRLIIRKSTFLDCKLFKKWESKEYIKRFFTIDDWRDYEDILTEFILITQNSTKIQLTIVLKETNILIGRIYISRLDRHEDSADITRIYIGEEKYLRKGYGKEAMKGVLKFFFEELKLQRVTLDFFEDNSRAKKLYESLYFKSEGVARNVAKKNNCYVNLHIMSILKEEYFQQNKY